MCCYIIQQFIFPLLVLISPFRYGGKSARDSQTGEKTENGVQRATWGESRRGFLLYCPHLWWLQETRAEFEPLRYDAGDGCIKLKIFDVQAIAVDDQSEARWMG